MVSYHLETSNKEKSAEKKIKFISSNKRLENRIETLSHEEHVIEIFCNRVKDDDIFWDIGSCYGLHTLYMAPKLKKVYAFEPTPMNRVVLIDNMQVNDYDNIWVEKRPLSDSEEKREFAIRESNKPGYGRHSFLTGDYPYVSKFTVRTADGDSLEHKKPTVVKIDVEGAEGLVIDGMKNTLSNRDCHTIIVETHEPNDVQPSYEDYGYTYEDIIAKLEGLGFSVTTLGDYFYILGSK